MKIEFDSEVTLWGARDDSSWYFATVPEELSESIKELPRPPRGFGSLRVRADRVDELGYVDLSGV